MTVAFRSIVATLAIAVIGVRPVLAQPGSSSLTHTVSVTVQPRVKVVNGNVAAQPAGSTQAGPFTMTPESNVGSVVDASISTGGVDTAANKPGSQNDGAVMMTILAP